jgi:GNAT superfamily N-acetyltransferase
MSAGKTRIRAACAADLDVLVDFAQAMARETEGKDLDDATLRPGCAALLADPELGRTFVVESKGEVVASLMVTTEWSEWRNGLFWWIQSVYVRPGERGRGHYRRLHEHVRALAAQDPRVCGLRLYVERENTGAQATYLAMGMEETHYLLFEESIRPVK